PVFLDEWVSFSRLKKCLETVSCTSVIAGRKLLLLSYFAQPLRKIRLKLYACAKYRGAPQTRPYDAHDDETALVTFTTGTTGTPKAANRTHGFLYAQYDALHPLLGRELVSFVSLPVVVLANLGLGKTTVLPPARFSAGKKDTYKNLVGYLNDNRVKEIISSPSVCLQIATMLRDSSVKLNMAHVLTGGGAVFPADAQTLLHAFPRAEVTVVYGSTEAEPVCHIAAERLAAVAPETLKSYGLPVGRPIKCNVIRYHEDIIELPPHASVEELALPEGKAGEIIVVGPHVLKGYINNPEAERRYKLRVKNEVWHRTGDAGMMKDGLLYFLGPSSEIINYNSVTYYPVITGYMFCGMTGATRAALLMHDGNPLIIVESPAKIEDDILQNALAFVQLPDAAVKYVQKIPLDKRHRTKIDYDRLRAMIRS
ncbi:MAG: AMP-binding protein, partial [Taibaiella sp.]|nr:AMP-binding protein [Taibaiella sp.]